MQLGAYLLSLLSFLPALLQVQVVRRLAEECCVDSAPDPASDTLRCWHAGGAPLGLLYRCRAGAVDFARPLGASTSTMN